MKRNILSIICTALALVATQSSTCEAGQYNTPNSATDMKLSDEELREMGKWKNKSMDDLTNDAFEADGAALYMLGMTFLTGSNGFAIDVDGANLWFKQSASMGFAPSLNKIMWMYAEEYRNPFLALVYLNLCTSCGHPELIETYHKLRSDMTDALGPEVTKEVEKLAAEKMQTMLSNKTDLKTTTDKKRLYAELIGKRSITFLDTYYSNDYWNRVSQATTAGPGPSQSIESAQGNRN